MDPAWVMAAIAVGTAFFAVVGWFLRLVWRFGKRFIHFLDDYFGEPADPHTGRAARPGVMQRISQMENLLGEVHKEVHVNGGKSVKDVATRTEHKVDELTQTVENLKKSVDRMQGGTP